jgi:hypothetical protein
MTFTARVENLEIRGKEIKDGKKWKVCSSAVRQ